MPQQKRTIPEDKQAMTIELPRHQWEWLRGESTRLRVRAVHIIREALEEMIQKQKRKAA